MGSFLDLQVAGAGWSVLHVLIASPKPVWDGMTAWDLFCLTTSLLGKGPGAMRMPLSSPAFSLCCWSYGCGCFIKGLRLLDEFGEMFYGVWE